MTYSPKKILIFIIACVVWGLNATAQNTNAVEDSVNSLEQNNKILKEQNEQLKGEIAKMKFTVDIITEKLKARQQKPPKLETEQ